MSNMLDLSQRYVSSFDVEDQERCRLVEFQPTVNAFACQPAAKKDCGPIASTSGTISTLPLDYENELQRCVKRTESFDAHARWRIQRRFWRHRRRDRECDGARSFAGPTFKQHFRDASDKCMSSIELCMH
jgi:hypothetical protein